MFTGIVKELGEVRGVETSDDGRPPAHSRRARRGARRGRLRRGERRLPDRDLGDRWRVRGRRHAPDARADHARRARAGLRASTSSSRCGPPTGSAATSSRGTSTGPATVAELSDDGFAQRLRVELPDELLPYVVEHGSIAIEGVSLTVAALADDAVEVSLIPETLERTTLGAVGPGDRLNVECDVLARYVRRQLETDSRLSPLSEE